LVLNHSFTLEYFIKPHEEWCNGSATLYASAKPYYNWDTGSVFSFQLNRQKLRFTEMPSRTSITAANSNVLNGQWSHVGVTLTWSASSGDTTITFIHNGANIANTNEDCHLFLQDMSSYYHFIGGVRQNWRLYNPYRGFMYQFDVSNSPKTTFTTTV
jgi:hypothetical protein